MYLHTQDQTLIDSISSWWCMIHGYKHPELTAAIQAQAGRFCHVMLGGLTHQPVEDLAAKLKDFLPGDLDHPFFSDSGSVGVEVALKMALQYNTNQGRKRPPGSGSGARLPRGHLPGHGGGGRRGLPLCL